MENSGGSWTRERYDLLIFLNDPVNRQNDFKSDFYEEDMMTSLLCEYLYITHTLKANQQT